MSTLVTEAQTATIQQVKVSDDSLIVDLSDGRSVSVPLAWYPRLIYGTLEERNHWNLIGTGQGIHWIDLDEDISVENIIFGQPSGESQRSFKQWLESYARSKANHPTTPDTVSLDVSQEKLLKETRYKYDLNKVFADPHGRFYLEGDPQTVDKHTASSS
jgi:hypothetical protein